MKPHLTILLLILLSITIGSPMASAQIVDEQGQYVDTTFHDNVDRTAEDFVIASLVVADPGTVLYSVLGHACIRLQCPAFGMDYCFSYESEGIKDRVFDFLAGNLKMGLFAIPVEEYCEQYREEGRGVYEYKLNLPIEVKRELWRIMDEHLTDGQSLSFDYFNRGCAITCVRFLNQALSGKGKIEYAPSLYNYSPSACELVKENTKNALWTRFYWIFIVGEEVMKPLRGDKQLLIPIDLVNAWKEATISGKPLILDEPNILVESIPSKKNKWFTPNLFALLLLFLSVVNLFCKYPYFDWIMLVAQTFVGLVMIYLIVFSDLCCTAWNWLIIPFNPLPIIFWRWRKYWALPYVGVLVMWSVAMVAITIWGNALVDWSHIVLVLAFAVVILKQSKILNIGVKANLFKV